MPLPSTSDVSFERYSDADLLNVILQTPARANARADAPSTTPGRDLMERFGALYHLPRRDPRELAAIPGIGPSKAQRLSATIELHRRLAAGRCDDPVYIRRPADAAMRYGPWLRDQPTEVFQVVLLNAAQRVIRDVVVSTGGLSMAVVEPRSIFRQAILENAASLICLHNHPSENPRPSTEDVRITGRLVDAGDLLGIPVQDHIIIAGNAFTSFADEGLLR